MTMYDEPIKVFVGCPSNNEDLEFQSVLEWSIRKNTKAQVDITWMQVSRDPASPWYSDGNKGWQTGPWTTPFSGFRWAIPEICGFEGQAIYTDIDVIFVADILELWREQFGGNAIVISKGNTSSNSAQRYCVSKWHCDRAKNRLPSLAKLQSNAGMHRQLMGWWGQHQSLVQRFKTREWNCLDGQNFSKLNDKALGAIHCTMIPTQPQLKYAIPRLARENGQHWFTGRPHRHPRGDIIKLFDDLLKEATDNGYGIERYRKEPFGEYKIRSDAAKKFPSYAGPVRPAAWVPPKLEV